MRCTAGRVSAGRLHRTFRPPTLKSVARPRTPKGRARETAARLAGEYPGSAPELCALDFANPFQLLVATVLSAQTTDEQVNLATPKVFARYATPADLGHADPAELETLIHSTGFFRSKARSLMGLGAALEGRFGGTVPHTMEELVTLPGVGRKTANVVLSVGFELPGLPVDTHVTRLTRRLGLTESRDPVHIESDVTALLPRSERGAFSLRLILHGRRVCIARLPRCGDCVLADFCPSAQLFLRPGGSGGGQVATRPRRRPGPAGGAVSSGEVPAAAVSSGEVPAAAVSSGEVPAAAVSSGEVPAAGVSSGEVPAGAAEEP
jgi:endonuclease III